MKLVLIILTFFSISVFAKKAAIPDPREVIAAQFSCNAKKINSWPWEIHYKEKTPFIKLAYKVTAIVKNFKVTDYEPKGRIGEEKDPKKGIKVSYERVGLLRCGEPLDIPDPEYLPIKMEETFILENAWKHPEWIRHSSDDPIIETNWISYLLGRDGANDEPSPEGRQGLTCLVRLEDFLKDSGAVKIDKLCSGEPKTAKEFTKKEIKRIIAKFSSQGG